MVKYHLWGNPSLFLEADMKYECELCGYVYDPEVGDPDNGIEPGTPWEEVPEDWVCPLCGAGKDLFVAEA